MKIITYLLLLFVFCNISYAQPANKWFTYYGEGNSTVVYKMVYDTANNWVYATGLTMTSNGIATPGSFKDSFTLGPMTPIYLFEGFLAKFDTLGNRLWATYYGGGLQDILSDITLDTSHNIYISGATNSPTGIATPGSFQYAPNNPVGNFLVKFDSDGNRLWGTYYSGATYLGQYSNVSYGYTCTDANNNVFLFGTTFQTDSIATIGSYKDSFTSAMSGVCDAFMVKFDSTGNRLWGTYYGGDGVDYVNCAYTDRMNNIYFAGNTTSTTNIASPGAACTTKLSAPNMHDGFIAKFNTNGERLWATYLGTDNSTYIYSIKGDKYNNVYVFGRTMASSGIATPVASQSTLGGSKDYFIAKYNSQGVKLWGTYWGGESSEGYSPDYIGQSTAYSISNTDFYVSPDGYITTVGITTSQTNISYGNCPYPSTHKNGMVAYFDPNGLLLWSSYLDPSINTVCSRGNNSFYIGGATMVNNLGTVNALMETKDSNNRTGFVAKMTMEAQCPNLAITISQNGNVLSVPDTFAQYRWYHNELPIEGATTAQYTLPTNPNGFYFVVIENPCNCVYVSDTLNFDPTYINNINLLNQLVTLSPIPANNFLTLQAPQLYNCNYRWEIMDIMGRPIIQSEMMKHTDAKGINEVISCSSLLDGNYYIKLFVGNHFIAKRFVIVN